MISGKVDAPGMIRYTLLCAAATLLATGWFSQSSSAHTPNTSYVLVEFTPATLRIEVRFDLESLTRVCVVDQNRDRVISEAEFRRIEPEIRSWIRRSIEFELNDFATDLGEYQPARWPDDQREVAIADWNQTVVSFPFERKVREIPEDVSIICKVFDDLGDQHKVLGAFRQPGKPSYEVVYTWFEPDFQYFTDYAVSYWSQAATFLKLGVEHIFLGYDHLLFLVALMIGSQFWPMVKIITSFTVAHTITLCLAATGLVNLPSRWLEVAIAATIVYVAIENLCREQSPHRWRLTFVFGLIHGFGFANVLRELDLPREGLLRCLLSFNVGVELGQLAIVACVWPLWNQLTRTRYARPAYLTVSIAVLACGTFWLIARIFV